MTLDSLLADKKLCQLCTSLAGKNSQSVQRAFQNPDPRLQQLQKEIEEAGRAQVLKVVLQVLNRMEKRKPRLVYPWLVNALLWGLWTVEGNVMRPLLNDISKSPVAEFTQIRIFAGTLVRQ